MKKVFFLYRTARGGQLKKTEVGQEPNQMLYGFWYLKRWKIAVSFSDYSYKKYYLFNLLIQPIQKIFVLFTSFGFKIDQAVVLFWKLKNVDVIVSTADSAGLPVLFLKKIGLLKTRVIYISIGLINEIAIRNNLISNFVKHLLSFADVIITHSIVEKKLFKEIVRKDALFIPFGIDYEYFASKEKINIQTKPFILSIGHDRSRDYQFLSEIAKKMPNKKFLVVTHKTNIEGILFPENVSCLFNISYEEVRTLYYQSELVFLPLREINRAAGQLSFLESLAASKKVVIANIKGTKDVYADIKQNVFYYEVGNKKDAIFQIKKAIKTDHKIVPFPRKYSSEKYAENILAVINSI